MNTKPTSFTLRAGKRPARLTANVRRIGDDICVCVWGGDRPHIGSVSVSLPRPSLKNNKVMSATSSVFNLTGHKDEVLARLVSDHIASELCTTTVVTAGVHCDVITPSDIDTITENACLLCDTIIEKLKESL